MSIDAAGIRETGMARAETEAAIIRESGLARGQEVEAVGMARARSFEAQVDALGQGPTALINAVASLAEHGVKLMPEILVAGGAGGGSAIDGLAAAMMRYFSTPAAPKPQAEVLPES